MHKFKLSEKFFSLQGESLYLGVPSVFLRFFGCNFSCSGFGMKRGELSVERNSVDPKAYKSYDDLPLVSTGCDSYASWDPRFKNFSPMYTTEDLVDIAVNLTPHKQFGPDCHLILTGGEPLLGWQKGFPELLQILIDNHGLTHVTFETNGTQPLTPEMILFMEANDHVEFFFSISAKLPVSGEKWEDAIRPDVVSQYLNNAAYVHAAFKFVVATDQDIEDVKRAVQQYWDEGDIQIPVYLMPVGGIESVYFFNNKTVAELALQHGFRYTPRLQVDLWKNAWAT